MNGDGPPGPDESRLARDVGWNVASLGVLALSGIAVNVIISRVWGATVFGVFSQVLALYYLVSQLAAGGFPFAALHDVGRYADRPHEAGRRLISALLPTAALASLVCGGAFAVREALAALFGSPAVGEGLAWTLPGLWCFAINKTMQAALNGLRMMRLYAAINAARYLSILLGVVVCARVEVDPVMLPLSISVGEMLLTPVLLGTLAARGVLRIRGSLRSLGAQLRFAARGFPAGLLHDLNPKLDVIMLGLFAGDRTVGIYAFAAMIVEGAYQVIWVLQTNFAPLLSRLEPQQRARGLRRLVRRNLVVVPPAFALASVLGWLSYSPIALWVTGDASFAEGRPFFAILMLGMTLASSWLPFALALNQWGRPGGLVFMLAVQFAVNVLLNLLLIPRFGAIGAASATAAAFVVSSLVLRATLRRVAVAGV